jgi:hypothetical protein
MSGERSKAWFAAKRYGYGSGLPIAWQGWCVLGVYFAIIALSAYAFTAVAYLGVILLATIVLIAICARTTEGGWRWRNGE